MGCRPDRLYPGRSAVSDRGSHSPALDGRRDTLGDVLKSSRFVYRLLWVDATDLAAVWSVSAISRECRAYGVLKSALDQHHRTFFHDRPALASGHPLKAKDLESALPPGAGSLARLLPEHGRHQHYLSGGSSQVLSLALLGNAFEASPGLEWLAGLLGVPQLFADARPVTRFEVDVDRSLLNEYPRTTAVDLLVEDSQTIVCLEAKYEEKGIGTCSCGKKDPGAPAAARCAGNLLERTAYWDVARDIFQLPPRVPGLPCPISVSYQAIRNVAAARELADGRRSVFALAYDERNPYFSGAGDWPGWVSVLHQLLQPAEEATGGRILFRAFSWQQLLRSGAVDNPVVAWANEKHLL